MFPILKARLELQMVPERLNALLEADATLTALGYQDHLEELQQMEGLQESADTNTFINSVEAIYKTALNTVLKQHGVHCDIEASIFDLHDVLFGLTVLDNYSDTDRLYALTDDPNSPEEALGELLELVGNYECEHYMNLLQYVSGTLIERIHALGEPDPLQGPSEALRARVAERLRPYVERFQSQRTLIIESLVKDERMSLGLPLSTYVEAARTALQALPVDDWALECLGLALASNRAEHVFRRSILIELEGLVDDAMQLTRVDVALGKLLKELG